MSLLFRLFIVSLLLLASASIHAAKVDNVRVWRSPESTRLVFDLSAAADHKLFSLSKPQRLVIDIKRSELKADLSKIDVKGTPIKSLRSASKKNGELRVVMDLSSSVTPKSFALKPNQRYGHRLVVDLIDTAKAAAPKTIAQAAGTQRDVIIALDAGHGGEDPGALGPKRLREKKITLAIAKKLARKINKQKGYKAVLIRSGDYYVKLKKRRDIARKNRADMLISIHADAFNDKRAHGASVFALSTRGATSETARYLARVEKESDLIGGVGDVSLDDKDDMVKGVILDLSMTATLSSSLDVGARVLKEMGKITRLHKKRVEQAGFAVLKRPDIPSILVETGFISNPKEARLLSSSRFQGKMADAIFTGVKSHFSRTPPEGSYLAWKKNGSKKQVVAWAPKTAAKKSSKKSYSTQSVKTYVIARGDTLSGVAKRYSTSVWRLKKINGLKSTGIWVGQKLKVPAS